jgi:hypothetical protein
MSPEQLDKAVDELVDRLLDLPPDEQQAALKHLGAQQPEVYARAASILAGRSTASFRDLLPSVI